MGFVAIDIYEGDRENSRGAKCEFGHSYVIKILKYSSDIHKSKSRAGFDSKRSCYCVVVFISSFLDEVGEEVAHAVDHGFEVVKDVSVWIGQS